LEGLAQNEQGLTHKNGGQPMSLTPQQKHLAQTIDQWVKTIEQAGGGETELLAKAFLHMGTFKQLLDASTPEQMNSLCGLYPGFYRFARLLEKLAQGIQDGTIRVPRN
jgi:hypothetical protein